MDAAWRSHVHLAKSYTEDHSRNFGTIVGDDFREDSHVHSARRSRAGKARNTKGNVQFFSCCIQLHTGRSIVIEYITTAQLLQDPPDHIISVLQTTVDIVADRIVEEGAL